MPESQTLLDIVRRSEEDYIQKAEWRARRRYLVPEKKKYGEPHFEAAPRTKGHIPSTAVT